jgi:hypothetical protein
MPTYQTTPLLSWPFPDQVYLANRKGKAMESSEPIEPLKELSHHVESHSNWYELAKREALGRVATDKSKDRGMLGLDKMNARSQRYERDASRSSVPNGVLTGPAMIYSATAGIRGGRIYTKEGQEWLERRLQERRSEFEAMSTGQFRRERPIALAKTPISPDTNSIDTFLEELYTALNSDVWGSRTTEMASSLLTAFFKEGASLSEDQATEYLQNVGDIERTTRNRSNAPALDAFGARKAEVQRIISFVYRYMGYCRQVLLEVVRLAGSPKVDIQFAINNVRNKILRETSRGNFPANVGPEQVVEEELPGVAPELPPLPPSPVAEAPAPPRQGPLGRFGRTVGELMRRRR